MSIKSLLATLIILFVSLVNAELPEGFVYLSDEVPHIQIDLRYAKDNNFLGRKVFGYQNAPSNKAIVTKQVALALREAEEVFNQDGFSIVLYDAYRPQKSVDDFVIWAKDIKDNKMKEDFYPRVDKAKLFALGYISKKSSHTRGSTVDISLIPLGKKVQPVKILKRKFQDIQFSYYDDGTIDMGTSFDLFDIGSHYNNPIVKGEYKIRRAYLRYVMEQCGFKGYDSEWWHFTYGNEPFPNKYFNFEIQ